MFFGKISKSLLGESENGMRFANTGVEELLSSIIEGEKKD